MQRRSFVSGLMAASAAGAAGPDKKTRFYALEQYFLKQGTQIGRVHELWSQGLLPAMNKIHNGPKIFLEALIAPHMPQVAAIFGYDSLEQMRSVTARLHEDQALVKAFERAESGPEALVEQQSTILLEATDYSPEIVAPEKVPAAPRIFELRVYHSPTWRQLHLLHQRFAGPEIKIFHRVGVHPLLYTQTIIGPNMPNLTYLIPFDNLAAREKAWNAFGADPEWIKVRQESIDKGGQISSVIQIALYKATAYSPIR